MPSSCFEAEEREAKQRPRRESGRERRAFCGLTHTSNPETPRPRASTRTLTACAGCRHHAPPRPRPSRPDALRPGRERACSRRLAGAVGARAPPLPARGHVHRSLPPSPDLCRPPSGRAQRWWRERGSEHSHCCFNPAPTFFRLLLSFRPRPGGHGARDRRAGRRPDGPGRATREWREKEGEQKQAAHNAPVPHLPFHPIPSTPPSSTFAKPWNTSPRPGCPCPTRKR